MQELDQWVTLLVFDYQKDFQLLSIQIFYLPVATYQREHAPAAPSAAPWVRIRTAPVLHHATQVKAHRGEPAGIWREVIPVLSAAGGCGIGHHS